MALLYDKILGIPSLENRDTYFVGGKPIKNERLWDGLFKNLREHIYYRRYMGDFVIMDDTIMDTFAEIRDTYSGMLLHSSADRFKVYCLANGIEVINNQTPDNAGRKFYLSLMTEERILALGLKLSTVLN